MSDRGHTVKAFDEELNQLKSSIKAMMGLAGEQVQRAMQALTTGNEVLAAKTIASDTKVNHLQEMVNDCTLRLLAMRQPVAKDLRLIMAAHRMADDLERIADYAVGIARRSLEQGGRDLGIPVEILGEMGRVALEMMSKVKEAFEKSDLELAVEAWEQDDQIDDKYTEAIQELQMAMTSDPACVAPCMALLNAAKAIERIGDHTTNLSEEIYFAATGDKLAESKAKH